MEKSALVTSASSDKAKSTSSPFAIGLSLTFQFEIRSCSSWISCRSSRSSGFPLVSQLQFCLEGTKKPYYNPPTSPANRSSVCSVVGKGFILSASKLRALKALVAEESQVKNPTKTEVVSALVYRCAALVNLEQRRSFRNLSCS